MYCNGMRVFFVTFFLALQFLDDSVLGGIMDKFESFVSTRAFGYTEFLAATIDPEVYLNSKVPNFQQKKIEGDGPGWWGGRKVFFSFLKWLYRYRIQFWRWLMGMETLKSRKLSGRLFTWRLLNKQELFMFRAT